LRRRIAAFDDRAECHEIERFGEVETRIQQHGRPPNNRPSQALQLSPVWDFRKQHPLMTEEFDGNTDNRYWLSILFPAIKACRYFRSRSFH
jgi:hypothetical protein